MRYIIEKMLDSVKKFFNKPRKGKLFEFSSYLMYNPRPMQQIINLIKFIQPVFYGFFGIIFYIIEYYVVSVFFLVICASSIYGLYKHIKYKMYRGNKITINEVKGHIFKSTKDYTASKIISKVNNKYGR